MTQPTTKPFPSDLFKRYKTGELEALLMEKQRVIEQLWNSIRGHKAFQTKLIRTLNKN